MPKSKELCCLFVHIPKTAGTSIEEVLGMSGDWTRGDVDFLYGVLNVDGLQIMLQHATVSQLLQYELLPQEEYERYYKFAFVRNPWARAVSDYAWHKKHGLFAGRFSDFVEHIRDVLAEGGPVDKNSCHYIPQYDYVYDDAGECQVDFVGRFEALHQDFERVVRNLGLEGRELPRLKRSWHLPYVMYYTPRTYRIVKELYKKDIDTFGYSF